MNGKELKLKNGEEMLFEQEINKGISWLNETKPDWLEKINLEKLNMEDNNCILGQVFGNYCSVDFFTINHGVYGAIMDWAKMDEYGFSTTEGYFPILQQEWKRKILELYRDWIFK